MEVHTMPKESEDSSSQPCRNLHAWSVSFERFVLSDGVLAPADQF